MHKITLFSLIVTLFMPVFASAETVVRTGQNISVEAEQTVAGDYYVSVGPWSQTTMSGKVEGDMYAFGGVVTTNGTITKDLTIVGGSAQMHATVTDDVRIVAGEVTVADHVGGDLVVLGGMLTVLSTATIDGDLIFYGGTAEIAGQVKGSVLGTAEKMRIDATVGKNVEVTTAKSLTLGDTAAISGFVRYTGVKDLERAQKATVTGEVQKVAPSLPLQREASGVSFFSFVPLLITLFSTLVLFLLFRKTLEAIVLKIQKQTFQVSAVGVSALLFGPSLCVLLMLTGLGFVVGLMTLALLIFIFILAYTVSGVMLGSYLAKWFTNHPRVSLLWVVAGTLALQVLLFVPILGVLTLFVATIITIGGLLLVLGKNAINS